MVNNLPISVGDVDSINGSGRSLGEENGNPLQYSCLGNPMDRRAWGHKRVRYDLVMKQQLPLQKEQ